MKKFELTAEQKINWFGRTLFRVKACVDFETVSGDEVHAGDLGGFIEKESNLSQNGKAWVYGNAKVYGNARVYGDAEVFGNAQVFGDAGVWGNAKVWGNAAVWGNASVYGDARVWDDAGVYGNARVCVDTEVWGNAEVCGNAAVWGNAEVLGDASVSSIGHIFCVTPIGEYGSPITLFRTKKHEIKISFEWDLYTVEGFKKLISEWGDKEKEVALGAVELAHKHIDLSEGEE